jgi:hypothetical protein
MAGDDRDLYECFRALRREEEASVPAISRFLPPARQRHQRGLPGIVAVATACLAAAIAAVVWLLPGFHAPHAPRERWNAAPQQAAVSITAWSPATDFLLNTPGRELLQDVPAIGEWRVTAISPGPGKRHRHVSKKVLP